MKLAIAFMVMALACGSASAQVLKGALKNTDRVVTNETDAIALAAVRGVSNTWAAAQATDRANRASEDSRVEGVASNLHALAQAARYAGDTNLASTLEITRTNLLQHFTALVAAERTSRSNQVWSAADALGSESRATNALSRAIALEAKALALSFETNRMTRVYNPTNANEWTDGAGQMWGPMSAWVLYVPENSTRTVFASLGFPLPYSHLLTSGGYQLQGTGAAGYNYSVCSIGGFGGQSWIAEGDYTAAGVTNVTFLAEMAAQNAFLVYERNAATGRIDRVALRSELLAVALPTNSAAGWLVWDTGSNRWWQVTASNLSFKIGVPQ